MEAILNDMVTGNITWITAILWYFVALVIGICSGAIGGMMIGAEHMGKELAAMMGGLFGPVAAAPGVLVAIIILILI